MFSVSGYQVGSCGSGGCRIRAFVFGWDCNIKVAIYEFYILVGFTYFLVSPPHSIELALGKGTRLANPDLKFSSMGRLGEGTYLPGAFDSTRRASWWTPTLGP